MVASEDKIAREEKAVKTGVVTDQQTEKEPELISDQHTAGHYNGSDSTK